MASGYQYFTTRAIQACHLNPVCAGVSPVNVIANPVDCYAVRCCDVGENSLPTKHRIQSAACHIMFIRF